MTTKKVKVDVDADTRDAVNGMKRLRESISGANAKLDSLGKGMKLLAGAGAAGAVVGTMAALAGRLDEVARSSVKTKAVFGALAINISGARAASHGLITDLDLATKANEAMRLGVVKSSKGFTELVDVSARLGASVGLDAKDAMNSLTTAIGRQSPLMLDNLGIMLKVSEANEIWAEANGRTVASMSKQERATAFAEEAMSRAKSAAEGLTLETEGLFGVVIDITNAWDNWVERIKGADPEIGQMRGSIADMDVATREAFKSALEHADSIDATEAAYKSFGVEIDFFMTSADSLKLVNQSIATSAQNAADAAWNAVDALRALTVSGVAALDAEKAANEKAAQAEFERQTRAHARASQGRRGGVSKAATENPADATLAGQLFFAEQNEAKRELLEQQLEIERDANDAQAKAEEQHAKELAKIAKARAAELERIAAEHARRVEAIQTSAINTASALGTGMVSALIGSATDQKKVFAEEVKMFAGAKAKELTVQAAMHGFKAAAWAAALNPVKATAEGIAAGIAGAGAASMAATYGVASAAVGGGGGSHSASGPGNAFNLGGGRDGQSAPDAPISPLEDGLGASRPSGASSGGGTVINVSGGLVDGEKLARILQDYDRTNGRILA